MKKLVAALLGTAMFLGLGGTASAQAAGGNQRFIVIGTGSEFGENFRVIAVGPITGVGTFEETEDEDVVRFLFPEGTITLDVPSTEESEEFDERTCQGSFRFSGPLTIIGATGAFEGTTGSGQFSGQGRFIGTPGDCSDESAGFFFLLVTATADVSRAGAAAA